MRSTNNKTRVKQPVPFLWVNRLQVRQHYGVIESFEKKLQENLECSFFWRSLNCNTKLQKIFKTYKSIDKSNCIVLTDDTF